MRDTQRIHIDVNPSLHQTLKHHSNTLGLTMSAYVRQALETLVTTDTLKVERLNSAEREYQLKISSIVEDLEYPEDMSEGDDESYDLRYE